MRVAVLALFLALPLQAGVIDNFDSVAAWSAHPSDGVDLDIGGEGGAMRLRFDFHHHGGYAIARRAVDLDLPANFEMTFRMRANAPPNNLELKLIDASGDNVWWMNRREFIYPRDWSEIVTKKRQISFAWGPLGGGEPHHIAAIEIVVTTGSGGAGTVWIDDLVMNELPPAVNGVVHHGAWRGGERSALDIDLGTYREISGIQIRWGADFARDFDVELSRDGREFHVVQRVRNNDRRNQLLYLPDQEASAVRLTMRRSSRGRGYAIESLDVQPVDWAKSPNDFFGIVARNAARGAYPRYLVGEQPYWTIVGADGANAEALVGEDGNIEPFKGGFSIEPFVLRGGMTLSWADVSARHSLAEGDLPIPTVTWKAKGVELSITAAATSDSMLLVHYRLRSAKPATLQLAVRPFQVNPSTQFLNTTGGVAEIHDIAVKGSEVVVDGKQIHLSATPSHFTLHDEHGYASATAEFRERFIDLQVPLDPHAKRVANVGRAFDAIAREWREKLHRVDVTIPGAPQIARALRSSIAYMLISRDGASLEPGTRSYDRAWIRDAALMASLLLRLGHADVAKSFAEWFAAYQFDSGKVPCCVDHRGADPVPENDSHGELIYLVAEIVRLTGDDAFARRVWPHVDAAARYIDTLRAENHGEFEGLVTQSISHEGYSAKPMHSYWDDLFALRGLDDAAYLAGVVGSDRASEIARSAAELRRDLAASIRRTIETHHIDYVPGSAELGDFDATSTAIGISPLNLESVFPGDALRRTFDRYLASVQTRRKDYTPYEMRSIGALIRLGRADLALPLFDRFLADRRPRAWNEWAEVVGTELREPRFIGDMPHAWVASDFVRSVLDAIAFDDGNGVLQIGSGVPESWLAGGALHVGPLPTYNGSVDVTMRSEGGRVIVDLSGTAKRIVVHAPAGRTARPVPVESLPARVVFEH
jgi:hypothetical protein